MSRKTSKEAFEAIKASGLLAKRKLQVYEILFDFGPLTAGEVFRRGIDEGIWNNTVKGGICARLTDLRDANCVEETGERICSVSGRNTILWDVNGKTPIKPPPKVSNAEKIKRLERAVEFLLQHVTEQQRVIAWELINGNDSVASVAQENVAASKSKVQKKNFLNDSEKQMGFFQ